LVVVFEKGNKSLGFQPNSRIPARCFLPGIRLPLEKITVLCRRYKFLWPSRVVAVVGFASAGQCNQCSVMPVIVPQTVEIIAALAPAPRHLCFLFLVFGDQDD